MKKQSKYLSALLKCEVNLYELFFFLTNWQLHIQHPSESIYNILTGIDIRLNKIVLMTRKWWRSVYVDVWLDRISEFPVEISRWDHGSLTWLRTRCIGILGL